MSKKNRKNKLVNPNFLICAIDISKDNHHAFFRSGKGKESDVFVFNNNMPGFLEFYKKLMKFKKENNLSEVYAGFESTGSYGEPLSYFMSERGINLVQVNPKHSSRLKELSDNSPTKSDKKDPRVIADLMQLGHYLTVINPEGAAAELRGLTEARERLIEKRTVTLNQIHSMLSVFFPEFLTIMKNIKTKSSCWLLENHPSPTELCKAGLDYLKSEIKKVSRGNLRPEKIERLFEAANNSISVPNGQRSLILEVQMGVEHIRFYNEQIEKIEELMLDYLDEISYANQLISIPGLGFITVALFIGETAGFENFESFYQVEKLAGLNLCENSSGKRRGRHFISKRGRSLLRRAFYMLAVNSVKKGGLYRNQYLEYLSQGKKKNCALIAIARKLIPLVFAIATKGKKFDLDYYLSNKRVKLISEVA